MKLRKSHLLDLNVYKRIAIQLGLVYLMYTLARLIFFSYNHGTLGVDTWGEFWQILRGGLLFDTSAIAYTNSLIVLLQLLPFAFVLKKGYQKFIKWLYFGINLPFFILNLGDTIYVRFTGKRTSLLVFKEFANEDALSFLNYFIEFWPLTLIGLALIQLWIVYYPKKDRWTLPSFKLSAWLYYPLTLLLIVLSAGFTVAGIRGGFSPAIRPITPANALAYARNSAQANMVLNTPFVCLRLAGKHGFPEYHFMPKEEANQVFNPLRLNQDSKPTAYTGKFRGRNIVLIIWESLSREWIGKMNHIEGYKGFTPFIDRLLDKSYFFECAYANGGKSIDAMPSILASLPKPKIPFVVSHYSTNKLSSIARELRNEGYYTAYFHNAHKGSMGFDAMAQQLGFEDYFGRESYGNDDDFDGRWGIWDEPFLQFIAKKLSTFREPFFATEFTASSHAPFKVPAKYEDKFPDGKYNYHKVIPYTDYALEQFFKTAQNEAWYDNTLFIITADHSVYPYLDAYKTSIGAYSIPFIFFDPRGEMVGADRETIVQQADLLPTVMDLVGIKKPTITFGHNMFSKDEAHFALNTMNEAFQIIQGDYALQFDGEKVLALYNYKQDPKLKHNLKGKGLKEEQAMKKIMQAFLQELSERLRNDKLSL